ncbi:glycoside hydrolase family 16 protein [Aquihabitans sp. G128]|uniref:glycoside hydrolase family 16 protein n=1 Tax=Aquihabitans sp. G128 TaxID=2849779 RepID=UPI001C24818B|nr:glycoside hydrolase family 16 protein [Aquihabitans sp. G128]QXC59139.1 glycoside hydrolase family 16 protein [Aquihabitans sp. G128]
MSGLIGLAACQPTPPATPTGPAPTGPTVETPSTETTVPGAPTTVAPSTTTTAAPTTTTAAPTTTTAAPTTTTTPRTTTTTAAPTTTTTTPPAPGTRAGWTLVGGDEFNGTSVDTSKWKMYNNTYGDGNHELACLQPSNVAESGGSLKITSKRQTVTCPGGSVRNYTSGFLGSREVGKYFPRYARFEMRAKLPHAQGLWPAFWLRHKNGASTAEVDIMEYFHSAAPGKGYATLHLDGRKNLSKGRVGFEPSNATPAWHTWAVEISPDPNGVKFDFFMDDVKFHSYVDTQHNWTASADAASTWDIAINQAVGGDWIGDPDGTLGYLRGADRCSISGTAPGGCVTTGIQRVKWADPAATTYSIDYVRVYTR